MGEEFDLPNTVFPGFQVIPQPPGRLRWTAQHRFHVIQNGVIKGAPPDEWLNISQKTVAKRDITGDWPGTNEGGAFPCAGNGFIVPKGRVNLNADSRCPRIRPEP